MKLKIYPSIDTGHEVTIKCVDTGHGVCLNIGVTHEINLCELLETLNIDIKDLQKCNANRNY